MDTQEHATAEYAATTEVTGYGDDHGADYSKPLIEDTNLWVLVAFLIVVALLVWQKIPAKAGAFFNSRANDIQAQLDEARSLREEAQKLLADYQKRQREAEDEAQGIINQAKADAKAIEADARSKMEEQITRRRRAAEDRIARAEAQAIAEVRGRAADLAVAAARDIVTDRVDERGHAALVDRAISEVRDRLN